MRELLALGLLPLRSLPHRLLHSAVLRDAVLDAVAALLPVECAGCARPDRALCSACRERMRARPRLLELADGTPVVSALRYDGVVRHAILAFKEHGRTDLARALSKPMIAAVETAAGFAVSEAGVPLELCAVPSTREAWRRRGYRPVGLMLNSAGLRTANVLEQVGTPDEQKSLGREARQRNIDGTLKARRPLTGRRFIVVDDILTTGATLLEVARAIREGGGEVVCGATLAFTPRHSPAIRGS